jgi:hypothetical protein
MILVTCSPLEVHSKFVKVYCKGVLLPAEVGKKGLGDIPQTPA